MLMEIIINITKNNNEYISLQLIKIKNTWIWLIGHMISIKDSIQNGVPHALLTLLDGGLMVFCKGKQLMKIHT